MKGFAYVALGSVLLFSACSQPPMPPTSVNLVDQNQQRLSQMGQYTRMVALETHDDALLGRIDRVRVDPQTGDLLVSDKAVTHTVYRFSSSGKFLRAYGKRGQGPGEYETLMNFSLLRDGRVVLFSLPKRIIFEPDGTLVKETYTQSNDLFSEVIGDQIFVHSFNGRKKNEEVVVVLDDELNEVNRFHPYDSRMTHTKSMPLNGLTTVADQIVVSEFCDFQLSTYNSDGSFVQKLDFPNQNKDLEDLWKVSQQNPKYRKTVETLLGSLRRAAAIYGVGDMVYILERHGQSKTLRSLIWDVPTGQVYAFNNVRLFLGDADADYWSMNGLVGRYDKGLIGYCDDPATFERFKNAYPAAAELNLRDQDNPILMFFELSDPVNDLASKESKR